MTRVRFVMVRPAYPSNMGATARALKTMGHGELALVNPIGDHLAERAKAMAKHAHEILDDAEVYASLEEACADCDLVVGTTTRQRYLPGEAMTARQLREHLSEKSDYIGKVAMVFGTEATGLTNAELALCDLTATIPMANEHPSLNLAQAIMIFAYELSEGARAFPGSKPSRNRDKTIAPDEYRVLCRDLSGILEDIGIREEHTQHQELMTKIHHLRRRDLPLLFSLRTHLQSRLDRP